MKKVILSTVLVLTLLLSNFAFMFQSVHADDATCSTEEECTKKIEELTAKIAAAQNSAKTLAGEISNLDNQITLSNLKIAQNEEIINSYTIKIDTLEKILQERSDELEQQIVQSYKEGDVTPLSVMFSSTDFSQLIQRYKYLKVLQSSTRQALYDSQKAQTSYAVQKTNTESAKARQETLKKTLTQQQNAKQALLTQTKNNEATFQRLLSQAKAQRDALKSAVAGFGGSHILPPQPSPDGWYFNQRDERWGMVCIGGTCGFQNPSYVWEVGCLITSVAMLQKKNGADVTPGQIASRSEYFFEDLMLLPWPAQSGYKFTRYAKNMSLVDSELSSGRPVVIELLFSGGSQHFVVFKSKDGSDYIMNDPWFGPDLKFSDHYSSSNINSVSTYTRT
jgi:peptidoglycan hydrolase CwlO-like protein